MAQEENNLRFWETPQCRCSCSDANTAALCQAAGLVPWGPVSRAPGSTPGIPAASGTRLILVGSWWLQPRSSPCSAPPRTPGPVSSHFAHLSKIL